MMTPGDFASLQEGREGLSTEDYIAWKLPYVYWVCPLPVGKDTDLGVSREEEDPDDYPFPLTLRAPKKPSGPTSPVEGVVNGTS